MRKVSNCFIAFVVLMISMTAMLCSIGCHRKVASTKLDYSRSAKVGVVSTKPVVKNGSSILNAVIVDEKSTSAGIRFEHLWTTDKYPGYSWDRQVLYPLKGRYYDVITLQKGKDIQIVYFDITSFYGKW